MTVPLARSAPSPRFLRGEGWGEGQTMRGPDNSTIRLERPPRRRATDVETKLWFALRDRRLGAFKFVRQEAIRCYIVDFVCREKNSSSKWMEASTQRVGATTLAIGCSPQTVITFCVSGIRTC
jgi:hypothetical protein